MKLWMKILIALVLGIITGLLLGPKAIYLKPIGTVFLNSINMIIVLLVFSSMTVGITSINDPKKLSRVGSRTVGLYLATTIIATAFGISFAKLFKPGIGLTLQASSDFKVANAPQISDILMNIIPSNPIAAMVNGNIIQIIAFSLLLGMAINLSGEKGKPPLECPRIAF